MPQIDAFSLKICILGHSWVLQSSCSVSAPVHVPPCCSSTVLVRVLVLLPVPQDTVHSVPVVHSAQTQSTKDKFEDLQTVT